MSTTFTTPAGHKVRSSTQRAYVLIWEVPDGTRGWIEKRSDRIETLRKHRRSQGFTATRWYIGTMATGELVPA